LTLTICLANETQGSQQHPLTVSLNGNHTDIGGLPRASCDWHIFCCWFSSWQIIPQVF